MPCRSDGYETENHQEELDTLTRMLCDTCRAVEEKALLYNLLSKETIEWWQAHKLKDAQRRMDDKAEQLREDRKKKALEKLTKVEKELLGLR